MSTGRTFQDAATHPAPPLMGSDEGLLARYRDQTDAEAFAVLVARHLPAVRAVARRTLSGAGESASVDDVAQSVFILLSRKPPTIPPGRSLAGWLHRTSHLMARDSTKSALRRRRREATYAAARPSASHPNDRTSDLAARVDAELDRLPDTQRQALLLRFFSDLPTPEVARALGIPPATAAKRLTRALTTLRQKLGPAAATPSALPALLAPTPPDLAGVPEAATATVTAATSPAVPTPPAPTTTTLYRLPAAALATAAIVMTAVLLWPSTPTPSTTPTSAASTPAALTQRESDALLEQALAANEATAKLYRTVSYTLTPDPSTDTPQSSTRPAWTQRLEVSGNDFRVETELPEVSGAIADGRRVSISPQVSVGIRNARGWFHYLPSARSATEYLADEEGNVSRIAYAGWGVRGPRPELLMFGDGKRGLRRLVDDARAFNGTVITARRALISESETPRPSAFPGNFIELEFSFPDGPLASQAFRLDASRGYLIVERIDVKRNQTGSIYSLRMTPADVERGRSFPSRVEEKRSWSDATAPSTRRSTSVEVFRTANVSFAATPATRFDRRSVAVPRGARLVSLPYGAPPMAHSTEVYTGSEWVNSASPEGRKVLDERYAQMVARAATTRASATRAAATRPKGVP